MEDVMDLRQAVRLGLVQSVYDSGQVQTAVVEMHDGVIHEVDVFQLDGVASNPQVDGAIALLLAVGNDPSHYVALIANPSTRFGNQAPGERTLAAPDGTRIAVRTGGVVEIWAGNTVKINAPSLQVSASGAVQITASGGVQVTGNASISGSATIGGSASIAGSLTVHGTIHNP